MSQIKFIDPIQTMHGKFAKNSKNVMRKKAYKAPSGKVIKEGPQESYQVTNPRNYDENPPKGAELANIELFTESKRMTTEILRSAKFTDEELNAMSPEQRQKTLELREELENFKKRYLAQFKRPDPEAPFEKKLQPGKTKLIRKQYFKFDNFIQAIFREQLRKALSANLS